MPTERFFNLPKEKQKRIIQASLAEFARVPFEEISINQIIQEAGIPRGSFYQYFEDKMDLQTFLLGDFRKCLEEKVEEYLIGKKGDLFQFFKDALEEVTKVGMDKNFKDVCKNVFSQMKYGRSSCKDGIFAEDMERLFKTIIDHMKEEYYKEYSLEEIRLIWEILLQLTKEAVVRIFLFEENRESIIENYNKKVAIIEIGMKTVKERENV